MSRMLEGTVVADHLDKTITVAVKRVRTHRIYRKRYTVTKKFLVHDEGNQAQIGDFVAITEGRPVSKRKRWQLQSVKTPGATV